MPDLFHGPGGVALGVLSDTHLPYRMQRLPRAVFDIFRDVDIILHAGDVDRVECLRDLAALAPLHAVRGNPHLFDLSDGGSDLPADVQLTLAGYRVVVNHGGWPSFWSQAGDWLIENLFRPDKDEFNRRTADRLARLYPDADIIVFGHTHRAYQAWHNRTLVFNPGAVCFTRRQIPSVGRLYLGLDGIQAKVIRLT